MNVSFKRSCAVSCKNKMLSIIVLIYVSKEGTTSKCLFPRGKLIQDAANAPHVRLLVIRPSLKNLWCHVDRGATEGASHVKRPTEGF